MVAIAFGVILALVGIIELIFMFVLTRIFKNQDSIFELIGKIKEDVNKGIASVRAESVVAIANVTKSNTDLLTKHYTTIGKIEKLESDLMAEVRLLRQSFDKFPEQLAETMRSMIPNCEVDKK